MLLFLLEDLYHRSLLDINLVLISPSCLKDINVLDDGRKKKIQSIRKEQFREKFVLLTCVFARVFKLSSFV